ncbi:hypothetical protein [Altibacter sp. HG106]|uniref:hypothetical protein n=1 Tax=Altibacter sp. HG106 TaxID=3023937 RepID=UPI00234FC6C1|nr:hypothetical protein [Altibacter sp. HG106]MDC7996031.1 hypothetical protein [Altibacter sp. HG106]
MLLNVSYNNHQVVRKIEGEVGKPFSLKERIKRGGIGIGHLIITEASVTINNLLILDNNRNVCNIEMRPSGIIVGFRSLLESYAWVIPYHKLTLYKGEAELYSIYRETQYVKVTARPSDKKIHRFMKNLSAAKATYIASGQFPS